MVKVRILTKCEHCNGKANLPVGEAINTKGETDNRHLPCPICDGTGDVGKWIDLAEFAILLKQSTCIHEHISASGSFHLIAGEVWDDIQEVCDDCGDSMR